MGDLVNDLQKFLIGLAPYGASILIGRIAHYLHYERRVPRFREMLVELLMVIPLIFVAGLTVKVLGHHGVIDPADTYTIAGIAMLWGIGGIKMIKTISTIVINVIFLRHTHKKFDINMCKTYDDEGEK